MNDNVFRAVSTKQNAVQKANDVKSKVAPLRRCVKYI